MIKNNFLKLIGTFSLLALSGNVFAIKTFGEHLTGHGSSELGQYFSFAGLFFAFLGFMVVAASIGGMISIKLFSGSPLGQKAEQVGMGSFFIAAILGGLLGAVGTVFYFLIGSAAGSDADASSFDRLGSNHLMIQDHRMLADASNYSTIVVKS